MVEQTTDIVILHYQLAELRIGLLPSDGDEIKKIGLVQQGFMNKFKLFFVLEKGFVEGAAHLSE